MPDFEVTPETITKISSMFCVPEQHVADWHDLYKRKIKKSMKLHYLAHVIRTMEESLRELPGNEMFRIICTPVAENSENIGIASSHYYKGRFFAIYYHPSTNEKQLRIMLAHELGHLFLLELVNTQLGQNYDGTKQIEPLSTIMGIFTIFDKNEFYHNKTTAFTHISKDEVLNDFHLLHNRNRGRYNI